MKPFFVHVGLPRAGSTFFQNRIFRGKDGIQYLGKDQHEYPDWLMEWHYLSDHEFSQHADGIRSSVDSLQSAKRPNVLSSEMFTMWGGRASSQAERLHRLFPEARVILILREPISRIVSFYKAIVERDGFFKPLSQMIDWKELPFVDYKRKPIQIADFRYDLTVNAYRSFFGEEGVCVLRLEDMKAAPQRFWGRMSEFMSVPFGEREMELARDTSVNASPSSDRIGRIRLENLRTLLSETLDASKFTEEMTRSTRWLEEELLPGALRKRLDDALKDQCEGYYAGV